MSLPRATNCSWAGSIRGVIVTLAEVAMPSVQSAPTPLLSRLKDPRAPIALALLAVYVIWGSTYLALRVVVASLPPLLSAGGRYLVAGVALYAFCRLRGAPRPTKREWLSSLPVGALLFLVGNGFVSIAETSVASNIAAVVCGTIPLLGAGMSALFGARPSRREWLGLVLGLVGVVVMSAGGEMWAEPRAAIILMLAPVGWAIGSVIATRLTLPKGAMGAAAQMITGGMATLLAGLARGEPVPTTATPEALLALLYLAVFGSIVAFSAYLHLLRTTSAPVAMSYAYVNPALALFFGAALGNERIHAATLAATALIAGGVALTLSGRSRGAGPSLRKREDG